MSAHAGTLVPLPPCVAGSSLQMDRASFVQAQHVNRILQMMLPNAMPLTEAQVQGVYAT